MTEPTGPSRRSVIRAGAWSVPALAAAIAAPRAAASGLDPSHVISITGVMGIIPTPSASTDFLLDYNGGSTTFDASTLFSTPAGDTACADGNTCTANGYTLYWEAASTVDVPDDSAFVSHQSVTSVTIANTAWGFNAQCTVRVTAVPLTAGYSSVSYEFSFFVTDAG